MVSPFELHLHTNDDCNLHCRHCYNGSEEGACCHRPSEEAILQTLRYFYETYQAEVHLEGGEIFLRPELLSRMSALPEKLLANITITTNGTIRNDDPAALAMLRKLHLLRVSVEGHTERQQRLIRGIPLKQVLENAMFYQSAGVPVCLRLTLNKLNYRGLVSQTIPALIACGFSVFQVYEFQSVGRGAEARRELALDFPLDELWAELYEHRLPKGTSFHMMFPVRRGAEVENAAAKLEKCGFVCARLPSESGLSIHADGGVFLCAWDNDSGHQIVNWYSQERPQDALQSIPLTHTCEYCSAFCVSFSDEAARINYKRKYLC